MATARRGRARFAIAVLLAAAVIVPLIEFGRDVVTAVLEALT